MSDVLRVGDGDAVLFGVDGHVDAHGLALQGYPHVVGELGVPADAVRVSDEQDDVAEVRGELHVDLKLSAG